MPASTTDLIPVRALNQVTYCPRLYYLQYVDAVMPTNEHVEGGLFDHRRVDSADLKNKTRKDGDTAGTRGVALSFDALGISGVLDAIEEQPGVQYPVETKHGSAPRPDAAGHGKPAAGFTRVSPQADDGAVLSLQEPGSHVGKPSEPLVVKKGGGELNGLPIHAGRQVVVFGNVQVSTQALETLVLNE